MKQLIAIGLFLHIALFSQSQSHSKNTISFNLDYDFGVHGTVSEYYYNSVLIDQDTSAAGTQLFRFDAHYNPLKFLSVGFNFRKGSYIEDPENAEADGNSITVFGLGLRGYAVNKNKFALYFGINYGISKLEINRIYTFITTFKYRYLWSSPHFSGEMGFNWYFAKNVGLNFFIGYTGHNFDLKEYYINDTAQDLSNQKHVFITKGVQLGIGLAIHLFGE